MEQVKTEIATVVYLVKGDTIYLSKKKSNVHMSDGKDLKKSAVWNGYGGKLEKTDTSILHTAVRELKEESSVAGEERDLVNVGELSFYWPGNETANANMRVHFYILKSWEGEPVETETMEAPKVFNIVDIPYSEMMPADKMFMPRMLRGEKVSGSVYFAKKDEKGLPLFVEKNKEVQSIPVPGTSLH